MLNDFELAIRSLRKSPTVTAVALVVIALGIGAGTAIFSVADAVVLRGLPYSDSHRIAAVLGVDTRRPVTFGGGSTTPQTYLDWRRLQKSFEGLAMVGGTSLRLKTAGGEPAMARGQLVTWEFFRTLRAAPLLGSTFTAENEVDGRNRVVVLSYGFWQRQYAGARDVIGRTIQLNEEPWDIVGVMPRGFEYPAASERPTELYVPRAFRDEDKVRANDRNYNGIVIGRLKPGITMAKANAEMTRIAAALESQYPKWEPGWRANVVPLQDHFVGKVRGWMLMLLGAVMLVVLIACANVANLMGVRATVRSREIGIRAALGASRWRLARALLAEGLVLSSAGTLIGIALAYAGVALVRAWLPPAMPRVASIAIDLRVLAVAAASALVTGVVFGTVPALQTTRLKLTSALKDGGRWATAGVGAQRLRGALVVFEIALAMVLLVGTGLFVTSFVRLVDIDTGFDYQNVLVVDVAVRRTPGMDPRAAFEQATARGQAYVQQMLEAVRRAPRVEMASAATGGVPLSGSWSRTAIEIPGRGEFRGDESIDLRRVTPTYLKVLRVPLIRGRHLTDQDRDGTEPVVVVNQCAARKYWPGQDALGQRVKINNTVRTVVGIVGDIRHLGPESPVRQEAYLPLAQTDTAGATLVLRTSGDPLSALPSVKAAIWSVDPEQRVSGEIVTLEGYMDRLIAQRRFNMAVLALFGLLGLVIAAAGIYGVMAYVVTQRTGEIGVRMALGATRWGVISMVLGRAMVLTVAGLALGGLAAWYLSASVRTFLFEVQPGDARIFVAAFVILAAAGLAASAVPARRAARVDPLVALRYE